MDKQRPLRQIKSNNIVSNTNDINWSELIKPLSKLGYAEYVTCFNPLTPTPLNWKRILTCMPPKLTPVVRLFLLEESVPLESLPSQLHALTESLLNYGILTIDCTKERVNCSGLILLPLFGMWMFLQAPRGNSVIYYGEDSMSLLTRLMPPKTAKCLDLCSGAGLLALYMARFCSNVTAVELDELSARIADVNTHMNDLTGKLNIVQGDLYQPLGNKRFDYLTANPPILPLPKSLAPPILGSAGEDGLLITKKILSGLPDYLEEHGCAHITGLSPSNGDQIFIHEDLDAIAKHFNLDISISTISHMDISRKSKMHSALINTLSQTCQTPVNEVIDHVEQWQAQYQSTHLCSYFIRAQIGKGELTLINIADNNSKNNHWLI